MGYITIDLHFTENRTFKMSPITFNSSIRAIVLDIEGTVAPITFVKESLFPYFLKEVPSVLSKLEYPISSDSTDTITQIVSSFPVEKRSSSDVLYQYIADLVNRDIKDSTLKSLQGFIWQKGYENGALKAPVYDDAIDAIKGWSKVKKVYIYSSGSVKAQKLLFGYVDVNGESVDFNRYLSGYFDITTSGYKYEKTSYEKIVQAIDQTSEEVLFLSDNVAEVKAAKEAGLHSVIVSRPGNADVSEEDQQKYGYITSFEQLLV